MRASLRLLTLFGLAVAGPALALPPRPVPPPPLASYGALQAQTNLLQVQQDLAARQAEIQQMDAFRLENQMRTEQNLASLRALGTQPPLPAPVAGAATHVDAGGFVSIPDSALAASNAAVRAAADGQP